MSVRPSNFNQIYPDQAIALCSREQATQLVEYDHHSVTVFDKSGVLLTYEWMPLEDHTGPFILTVVFHFAEKHPPAPDHIQVIVDGLKFRIRGQPR